MIEYAVLYLLVGMFLAVSYNVTLERFVWLAFLWPAMGLRSVRRFFQGFYDGRRKRAELGSGSRALQWCRHNAPDDNYIRGFVEGVGTQ